MHINRQRQLPPDDWKDSRLVVLPPAARHLATGLRMMADPEGRGPLNLHLIRSTVFPSPDVTGWWPTLGDIETFMLQLDDAKWLTIYPNPDPPPAPSELFQILARWPHVSREGESRLKPPPRTPACPPSGRNPGSGESGGVRASEGVRGSAGGEERAGERAGLSGSPSPSSASIPPAPVALPPSPFCSVHLGGAPEQVDCRDCGTARLRHQRYAELLAARRRAAAEGSLLAAMSVQAIDLELRALSDAAARALLGTTDTDEPTEPEEYLGPDGLIDHT